LRCSTNLDGIHISSGASINSIGGTASGARNIISGNQGPGIMIAGNVYLGAVAQGNVVQGNYIGTDVTGLLPVPNGEGVQIFDGASGNLIGGTTTGAGNVIAFNQGAGVAVTGATTTGNAIRGNSIHDNTGLGIDLGGSGVPTPNGSQPRTGPNNLINFPVLTVAAAGLSADIRGTYTGLASTTYTLDFYANPADDPSGYGQGRRYLGSGQVTTGPDGNATFDSSTFVTPLGPCNPGEVISATATDANGDTSEFTQDITAKSPTSTAVSSSVNPSVFGQALTFTATVTANITGAATPTGTVQFVLDGQAYGAPVALSGGTASVSAAALTAGSHTVAALYGGDAGSLPSDDTAAPLGQIVTKAMPTVAVSDAGGTYNAGAFPATATVAGVVAGVDDTPSASLEGVSLTLDYLVLDGAGNVVGDLGSSAPVGAGTYRVTASFAGSADYTAASASATFTIAKATPIFSLVTPPVVTDGAASATLSGSITAGSLVPPGSVTVTINGVSATGTINPDGTFAVAFPTAALPTGAYQIQYDYAGDANFEGVSAVANLDVTYGILVLHQKTTARAGSAIPIQIELLTASGQDVSSAGTTVTAVQIAPAPGQSGSTVSLNDAFTFNPQQGTSPASYTYTLKTKGLGLSAGTYLLYFTVAGDPLEHSVGFTIQ
jgi:hypothetical protein